MRGCRFAMPDVKLAKHLFSNALKTPHFFHSFAFLLSSAMGGGDEGGGIENLKLQPKL